MGFNNGPKLVTTGLDLLVDAADPSSYPGSGTVWTDLRSQTTGSLTGSVSYTSEFYGGLTFTDSSSAVIFPGSTANYGTGSFTVEMAFKPDYIEGRHYLMSKNSGSFPNWSIYLSGSSGQGKLWSEFNIDASVSCSISSSTTFETGSVYQVDVKIAPGLSGSGITINGQVDAGGSGNGAGSLANTGSLFLGNYSQDNTQNFSGSIYAVKTYTILSFIQPVQNFNATAPRLSKTPSAVAPAFELLVVAGGGGGNIANGSSGGGGAGGLYYASNYTPPPGTTQVVVGNGGSAYNNGQNSNIGNLVTYGGGRGGRSSNGSDGGSGGGGGYENPTLSSGGSPIDPTQGNPGGNTVITNSAAGGGGAGSAGSNNSFGKGGDGGSGSYIASFAAIGGSPAGWFAGGGGGGVQGSNRGLGGIGGGGFGGTNSDRVAGAGSKNTGGGGGGNVFGSVGRSGGSGIVAIRYSGAPIALGGEITQSEGYTYHVYRTVGTSSFTIF